MHNRRRMLKAGGGPTFHRILEGVKLLAANEMEVSLRIGPVSATFAAICIASAFATLIMGLYANYPIAVAPGMGLVAYFTYTVYAGMGLPWQIALGAVFISGVVFFLLFSNPVRQISLCRV